MKFDSLKPSGMFFQGLKTFSITELVRVCLDEPEGVTGENWFHNLKFRRSPNKITEGQSGNGKFVIFLSSLFLKTWIKFKAL